MPSLDDRVAETLEALRTCLKANLADDPPCWTAITYGNDVPMDFCGCTQGQDDGGQAFVRLAALWSSTTFPQVDIAPSAADAPLAMRVVLGVYRPVPGGFSDEATAELYAAQQRRDAIALWKTATCCGTVTSRRGDRGKVLPGTYLPVGPNGACAGGALPVTLRP